MTTTDTEVILSASELMSVLESGARARLDMSAADMLSAYASGTLADLSHVSDLIVLADLLPSDFSSRLNEPER
jgi:hypothetical protein